MISPPPHPPPLFPTEIEMCDESHMQIVSAEIERDELERMRFLHWEHAARGKNEEWS